MKFNISRILKKSVGYDLLPWKLSWQIEGINTVFKTVVKS